MKPRITFRVNGARVGDVARPTELPAEPVAGRLPMKRAAIVARAALSTRPNEYMPDDDGEVAS